MTVVQYNPGQVKYLMGLAADTPPTTSVPRGSQFFETDTGITFIFDGTDWVQLSDGAAAAVSQSGIWTVQPGNTANTTPWLVTPSGLVVPAHTAVVATTTTGALLASNAARKYALFINDGSVDVYAKIAAAAVASQGIRLMANGGSFALSAAYGNLATGAVNGITASGTANVLVTEGV